MCKLRIRRRLIPALSMDNKTITDGDGFINGMPDIVAFTGKSESTIRRWCVELNYPLRKNGREVFIDPDEHRRWKRARSDLQYGKITAEKFNEMNFLKMNAYEDFEWEQKEDEELNMYDSLTFDCYGPIINNLNYLIPFGLYMERVRFLTLDYSQQVIVDQKILPDDSYKYVKEIIHTHSGKKFGLT